MAGGGSSTGATTTSNYYPTSTMSGSGSAMPYSNNQSGFQGGWPSMYGSQQSSYPSAFSSIQNSLPSSASGQITNPSQISSLTNSLMQTPSTGQNPYMGMYYMNQLMSQMNQNPANTQISANTVGTGTNPTLNQSQINTAAGLPATGQAIPIAPTINSTAAASPGVPSTTATSPSAQTTAPTFDQWLANASYHPGGDAGSAAGQQTMYSNWLSANGYPTT